MSEYGYALERICKIMDNIEKDLHSIDISLGAMRPNSINDVRQRYGFEPIISKSPTQIIDEAMANKYGNKEENNETRN